MSLRPDQIIKRPIAMTEKAQILKAENNQVIFEVERTANKIQIRQAVESLFEVKVLDVHTLIVPGKAKRLGRKEVKRSNWKKAIVTLSADHDIQFITESEEN